MYAISEETRNKIAKLPTWARDLINRLETAIEPLLGECAKLRQANSALSARAQRYGESNEALLEILRSASRGGSDLATTVVSILDSYEIFQNSTSSDEKS